MWAVIQFLSQFQNSINYITIQKGQTGTGKGTYASTKGKWQRLKLESVRNLEATKTMKRDHISPFFSPCTVDCNYDPLGRAGSPTAETRQWSMFHSPGPQNHRTESLGPLDLSGHFTHIKSTREWSTSVGWKQKQQRHWDKPHGERWYVFIGPTDTAEKKAEQLSRTQTLLHQAQHHWSRGETTKAPFSQGWLITAVEQAWQRSYTVWIQLFSFLFFHGIYIFNLILLKTTLY